VTPKAVVNAIEARLGMTGAPRDVRDAIENELLQAGLSLALAAENVDLLRNKVVAEIVRRRDERSSAGEIAVIHVRGIQNEIVFGSSYVFGDDNEQIQRAKLNRVFADEIHTYVRALTFSEFERFGRSVLRELGCTTAKVTPHAGDQGIDFYGDINIGSITGADRAILKLMHETRIILVGQAKHYPNVAIGPATVRELVGALSLSRTSTYSREDIDLLEHVQLRPFSPVLALLFSTGNFTKGARHLATRAGLIALSGWQLAVFLADKGVGLVTQDGNIKFDVPTFNAWLE
jgi:hypothetical protein